MKLSLTITTLFAAFDGASASFSKSTTLHSGSAIGRKLLRNARRLEQNNYGGQYGYYDGEGGEEQEAWFLADYSLKMLSCISGEQQTNYEEGSVEPSTVIFRLCPSEICNADNSTSRGCEEGYGDYAVGINTFTQAYVESVRDNYNNGMQFYSYAYGEFNVEEYVNECRLFEEEGGDQNQYNYNYGSYNYIGPACTEDGTGIRLAAFSDPYCSQESSDSFESTHNGFALPFSDGGLVPETCVSCVRMNDNYEYELGELCQDSYQTAGYRCEENMQSTNGYYGPDTRGCDYLSEMVPANTVSSSWFSNSETTSEESGSSKSSGNFFSNQPESVKLAEEYLAILIISALVGSVFVVFCVRKTVQKTKAQGKMDASLQPKEPSKFVEHLKSGAVFTKVMALESVAKVKAALRKDATTESEDKASAYVAPVEEESTTPPSKYVAPLVKDASVVSC
mmetsp:Transcript_5404/g.13572  ORF Transcript_5404/g.13572 Transcript_5404/m.13572 type:complete len:451 (+) Transcript_5404:117-1469(+)